MQSKSLVLRILAVVLVVAPIAAKADSWSCRQGNNVREVHVERTGADPVPCRVVYRKLTEGVEDQVLWNAQFDAGYCDNKATDFVAKLESYGWTCVETIREQGTTE